MAATRTPVSAGAIRRAVGAAYTRLVGRSASAETLDILTAHVSHETAGGERMFNFNFGGIKGTSPSGLTARYRTHEYIDGSRRKIVDGFRAYHTLEEGAADYLKLLSSRYAAALEQANAGDVDGFSEALGRGGYFTAPADVYARALRARTGQQTPGTDEGAAAPEPLAYAPVAATGNFAGLARLRLDALPTLDLIRAIASAASRGAELARPQPAERAGEGEKEDQEGESIRQPSSSTSSRAALGRSVG